MVGAEHAMHTASVIEHRQLYWRMRSVADRLRRELIERHASMTADERLQCAFALADGDARALASARGISDDEAKRVLRRQRQHNRRYSAARLALLP